MILALDAMGGDKAPDINVEGAILAVKQSDNDVILVGKQDILYAQMDKWSKKYSISLSFHHNIKFFNQKNKKKLMNIILKIKKYNN